ncbi:MAG TPA: cupin domain-containing protein [Candidatus Didemnitutus sp.]|nr:cupin domain-containing protein [Candidatus Didemnitutus sp.]
MLPAYDDLLIKRFESPDEVRTFVHGKFELIRLGGMAIGRALYRPSWRWSEHVRPLAGTAYCEVAHVGMVVQGQCACAMLDRRTYIMQPGDFLYIGPGHDSWVVGDEPYVSLHFLGSEHYATR